MGYRREMEGLAKDLQTTSFQGPGLSVSKIPNDPEKIEKIMEWVRPFLYETPGADSDLLLK